jgi:hypothetical protein
MKDISTDIAIAHLMDAQDITNHTDVGSNYIDLQGFESAMAIVNLGTLTNQDANNCVIPVLQECDSAPGTNVSWSAVAAADTVGSTFAVANSAATDQMTQRCGYIGSKRYLRVWLNFTSAGANPDHCPVSIDCILSDARHGAAASATLVTAVSTA